MLTAAKIKHLLRQSVKDIVIYRIFNANGPECQMLPCPFHRQNQCGCPSFFTWTQRPYAAFPCLRGSDQVQN